MEGVTIMIPKDINDNHILEAAKEIDLKGIPTKRESRKYLVQIGDTLYPPKYIISLAVKQLRGQEMDSNDFIASEAKKYLEKLGYKITTK